MVPSMGLDAAALAWRRLLIDPCGATMVPPCYSGSGTGNYLRLRHFGQIGGSDTQGIVVYQPSRNVTYAWGSASGSNVTFSSVFPIFQNPSVTGTTTQIRCLSACMKVRYLGPESARAGTIHLLTGPQYQGPGIVTGQPLSTFLHSFPVANRLGEVVHEVKFVPLPGDEQFQSFPGTSANGDCGCLAFAYSGIPAGTIQVEVTAVYEYEFTGSTNDGVISSTIPPASGNTLNQVLRTLGPATNWAYSHVAAPVIRAAAGYATGVVKSAVTAASAQALRYAAVL